MVTANVVLAVRTQIPYEDAEMAFGGTCIVACDVQVHRGHVTTCDPLRQTLRHGGTELRQEYHEVVAMVCLLLDYDRSLATRIAV